MGCLFLQTGAHFEGLSSLFFLSTVADVGTAARLLSSFPFFFLSICWHLRLSLIFMLWFPWDRLGSRLISICALGSLWLGVFVSVITCQTFLPKSCLSSLCIPFQNFHVWRCLSSRFHFVSSILSVSCLPSCLSLVFHFCLSFVLLYCTLGHHLSFFFNLLILYAYGLIFCVTPSIIILTNIIKFF